MKFSKQRQVVPGSERNALRAAKITGPVDPGERIEVTVVLRPRSEARGNKASKAAQDTSAQLPEKRQYLSREEFAGQRGADPAEVAKVEAFANLHHLTVVESSLPKRIVRLQGTAADLTAAFQPKMKRAEIGGRSLRIRTGGVSVPKELAGIVIAILGFDDRPAASPHSRFLAAPAPPGKKARPAAAPTGAFAPPEVAKLYNFPTGLTGKGQCIAIIELNNFDQQHKPTGTGFSTADLNAYFTSLGLAMPSVTAVGVASDSSAGANVPGPDPNADGEVMLDIEVAGAVAPGASIAVYFALNTDAGFLAALKAALHDAVRKPSVVSISWGSAEDFDTLQARTAFDQALQDAAALGVTVCCSSGDDGSSDLRDTDQDGQPHVDFPASSAFALACGGTHLTGSGSTIKSEVVWNSGNGATGGGVSNLFSRPAYQSASKVPKSPKGKTGRGVPDIAANADPNSGYKVRLVGGQNAVIGGTSAVSPLMAGLVALINQRLAALGKPTAGFMNPILYKTAQASIFHDITSGTNDIEKLGKYKSGKGWDACTGLGSPIANKLLSALGG